jgi:hypothetical protein
MFTISVPDTGKARASRAARARARPAARSAGSAMMASLAVASQSSVSSTEIVRLKPNEETSPGLNGAASGITTVCCLDRRSRASRGSGITSSAATQSSSRFRLVHNTPSRPPSLSTRAISVTARSGSNQCHACDTNTASA